MYVLSTAGHVDHGKSALIQRVTGIDPDRLAEEKRRGLTIDLGFAWLTLPSGREIGIVDVPGHERFVHNMLAGVGSVDATIFVVAANEGWRPQSEEHLAILDLLEARGGVVALTKTDTVDGVTREQVRADLAKRLAGTTLEGAEIVPVSALTGDGLTSLLAAIDRLLDRTRPAEDRRRARLFVDRSFSVKGAGTVVTGTLTGGRVRLEDAVEILPAGVRARVRGIQTHKRRREEAEPGGRVALNLTGVERYEVRRGDAIVHPGGWRPTGTLDVRLRVVRSLARPVSTRGAYKLYVGSAEVDARLLLYDSAEVPPGGEAFARLALAEPVVAEPFDGFVLRDTGRDETVAGGRILDAHPPPVARGSGARAARGTRLAARAQGGREQVGALTLAEAGELTREELTVRAGTDGPPADAVALRSFVLSAERFGELRAAIERTLAAFHAAEPLARGMPRDEAQRAAGIENPRLFVDLLEVLADRVAVRGATLALAAHRVTLSAEQEAARAALESEMDGAGLAPPPLADLARRYGEKLVRALLDGGDLVKVAPDIAFGRAAIRRARETIAAALRAEGPLSTSRLREVLGTSRKYAIPLLEHLDAEGFTRRRGDLRELV